MFKFDELSLSVHNVEMYTNMKCLWFMVVDMGRIKNVLTVTWFNKPEDSQY